MPVTEHEWTQPRPDVPRTDGKVSVVVWCATESGIVMDGELIGFPEVAREMIRLRKGSDDAFAVLATIMKMSDEAEAFGGATSIAGIAKLNTLQNSLQKNGSRLAEMYKAYING